MLRQRGCGGLGQRRGCSRGGCGGNARAGGEQIADGSAKMESVIAVIRGGAIIAGAAALSCYRSRVCTRHAHVHDYLERILKARVYDVAIESPLEAAPRLSRRLGNTVLFKREDLQPVFSFKLRGAYNKIAHLSETVAQRGVICASAGNHAQGVALAARRRGIPATIVMPQTTPQHQGAGGDRPRRRGGPARRRLRPGLRARAVASRASASSPSSIRSTIRT